LRDIRENQVIVCIGETGCGKTTQLPQYLLEDGYCSQGKRVAVTQPRRVAAVTVAQRVSEEIDCRIGQEVGHLIRFEDKTSSRTKLVYMTDGCLVRICLEDPLLSQYQVIMLDEAHERSIHTDILFGLLKRCLRKRPDLKLLVTSATLQRDKFASFFDCKVVLIPGRTFPVDIFHSKEEQEVGKKGASNTSRYMQVSDAGRGESKS
jgi:ATP-dependent RNA helicase DHX8/PRP22